MRREAIEEGKRWLEQAKEDLKWTKDLAERGGYHIACFLAQQVGEKALKAFLYAQGEEIVIGHSIERLCNLASKFDNKFSKKSKDGPYSTVTMCRQDIRTLYQTVSLQESTQKMLRKKLQT